MKREHYDRDARPVRVLRDGNARVASVICDTCLCVASWRIGNGLPAVDVLHNHFRRKGWEIDRTARCEACQAMRRKPKMSRVSQPSVAPEVRSGSLVAAAAAAGAAVALPSPAMRKAKVLVYMALDEYYDAEARRYRAGKSDKIIADECDVAEDVVAKLREADFGPLREPDEVRALREELALAKGAVAAIEGKFAVLAQRNGWTV